MVQRQGRAVGSNQYRERVVAISEDDRKAAREGLGQNLVPPRTPSAQTSHAETHSISAAAADHRQATDAHLEFALSLPRDMANAEAAERLRQGVQAVGAAEDEILGRHPNLYGHALVSANNFLVRAKHDPRLRAAVDNGDADAGRVMDACERLLADADEQRLDADGISRAISDLEGGGEWSAMATASSAQSMIGGEGDLALCIRAAALSVASSRSSDPQERAALEKEMRRANEALRASRMGSLG